MIVENAVGVHGPSVNSEGRDRMGVIVILSGKNRRMIFLKIELVSECLYLISQNFL
jgi:hypothetical protein